MFSETRINLFALVEGLSVLSVFTCLSVSYPRRSVSGSLKMKGEEMCVFFQTIKQCSNFLLMSLVLYLALFCPSVTDIPLQAPR